MSEAGTALQTEQAKYLQLWAASFAQVLGQISSTTVAGAVLEQSPPEIMAPSDADLWTTCTCSGSLRGEMTFRLSPPSVLRIAQIFMSETLTPDAELTPDHREAILEFLRQVAGLAASSIKAQWGEVPLRLDAATGPPSWPASSSCWLRAGEEGPDAILIETHLSAALVAALRADKAQPAIAAPAVSPAPAEGKLDLLMDVELEMTLRFGGRRLLLREILELSPGTVIELDRQVSDPVDLLLDGRLVARGEVVVMDGNYGLRVTELIQVAS